MRSHKQIVDMIYEYGRNALWDEYRYVVQDKVWWLLDEQIQEALVRSAPQTQLYEALDEGTYCE